MYIMVGQNCPNCKMLKQMLGENALRVEFRLAEENMDICRQLNIRAIPALVKDDETVVFDLGEIVSEVEKAIVWNTAVAKVSSGKKTELTCMTF